MFLLLLFLISAFLLFWIWHRTFFCAIALLFAKFISSFVKKHRKTDFGCPVAKTTGNNSKNNNPWRFSSVYMLNHVGYWFGLPRELEVSFSFHRKYLFNWHLSLALQCLCAHISERKWCFVVNDPKCSVTTFDRANPVSLPFVRVHGIAAHVP